MGVHNYHCLCSTHLLVTPYAITDLPHRAAPSLDKARILPLPRLQPLSVRRSNDDDVDDESVEDDEEHDVMAQAEGDCAEATRDHNSKTASALAPSQSKEMSHQDRQTPDSTHGPLRLRPSLLSPSLRPARRPTIVLREDGYEKRRVYRCSRCGLVVAYEIIGGTESARIGQAEDIQDQEAQRVMFLLEGGLIETGELKDTEEG